jgi:glycosyltransferase involved in cell wall biosynthesis
MTAIRVSVCIPTYNGAPFLAEAIASVLAQTFTDFELLLIDDRSTDATLDILHSFTDPRVRVYQNEKQLGIPRNWNRGLSLAQGEYICIFHQDDIMLPENLRRKAEALAADPTISFVHSAVEFLVEAEAPNPPIDWIDDAPEDRVFTGKGYFYRLLFHNLICAPTVMMRQTSVAKIGQFDERLGFACDYAMWLKLCTEGSVGFLSQPLLLYRWHKSNASHVFRFERGVDEALIARREALRHYAARTGKEKETRIFNYAIEALGESQKRTAALDLQSERQLAYTRELEQLRDKLWADVEKVGKSWEEQQRYIKELEQLRDTLWADLQRVGKGWEEQQVYIEEQQKRISNLEQQRLRLLTKTERLKEEATVLKEALARRLPDRLWRIVSQKLLRTQGVSSSIETKE